jgi:hypothetical protein
MTDPLLNKLDEFLVWRRKETGQNWVRLMPCQSFFDCSECGARRGDMHRDTCVIQVKRDRERRPEEWINHPDVEL